MFIPAQGEPVFLSRRRGELPADLTWKVAKYHGWSELAGVLGDFGYRLDGRIGLEMDVLPVADFLRLQVLWPRITFGDVGDQIRLQRAVKSPWEAEVMRETARRNKRVWDKVPEFIAQAETDLELSALIDGEAKRQGHVGIVRCHGFTMETVLNAVLTGENGAATSTYDGPTTGRGLTKAFPTGASGTLLEPGKPILIDCVGCFFGYAFDYAFDMTRTYSLGKPSLRVQQAYELVLSVQTELIALGKPGACCGDLYNRARAMAEAAGLSDGFMGADGGVSFVGHGIGLELNELPVLAKGSRQVLEAGMMLAIEPKVVLPGLGAVGLENTFLVTGQGLEKLCPVTDELIVI